MAKSHGKSGAKSNGRQARLAEALRENLRRRKAGARQAESGESAKTEAAKKDGAREGGNGRNPAAKTI